MCATAILAVREKDESAILVNLTIRAHEAILAYEQSQNALNAPHTTH